MKFLNCLPSSLSPLTVNLVHEVSELFTWFMKSLDCWPGSSSPWTVSLVQKVPELYTWFMKFLNCLPGSWSPWTVSLVQEFPELFTWFMKSLNWSWLTVPLWRPSRPILMRVGITSFLTTSGSVCNIYQGVIANSGPLCSIALTHGFYYNACYICCVSINAIPVVRLEQSEFVKNTMPTQYT